MKKHIITLGGLPGSGKSTIKKLLAEKLGYKTFSIGEFVREMVRERNMSLDEFNELIAQDASIDQHIDEKLAWIEKQEDNYVIDAHLAFHFVPSGFSVYLLVSPETSAERILSDAESPFRIKSGDVMHTKDESYARTQKRIKNHIDRYLEHYQINPYIKEQYQYVIDTERHTPDEIVTQILSAYTEWLSA